MSNDKPSYAELETRLAQAEATLAALRSGEVDSVVGDKDILLLRLKESEDTLHAKEVRYRNLVENMSEGVAVYEAVDNGQDFVFCEHNRAGEQITGLSQDQVLGRRVTEVFPGIEGLGLLDVFRQVWKTGQPEAYPSSQYLDERIILWVENYVFKLPGKEIVAVYRDITDRKQAELELFEANQIIIHSPMVACRWKNDTGWPVQFVSKNVEQLFGYSVQDFAEGKIMFNDIIHKDDLERVVREVADATIRESHICTHEPYRIITKSGEVKSVHGTTFIRQDTRGTITHYQGIIYDVTDQQAQKERIAHLTLLRKTLLIVHRHLATIQDTNQLLQAICDVFVDEQNYRSAWVALLDEKRSCSLVGSAGLVKDFCLLEQALEQRELPPCCSEVIKKRHLVWETDQHAFCNKCPLAKGDPHAGFMSAPMVHGERFYGVFTVTLSHEMVTDTEEQELFEEITRDIGFALFNREQDDKRQQHEKEIFFRDQISRTFILHDENNFYGEVLAIVLKAMGSKLGVLGYLDGPDMLICPSMTTTVLDQGQVEGKTIAFPREQWAGIWKKALDDGITRYSNTPSKIPGGHLAIDNSMATGIVHGNQVIGLLQVANKEGGYTKQDQNLLENIAITIAPIFSARLDRKRVQAQYRNVVQDLPLLICRNYLDGEIIFANNTYARYFQVDPDELVGQNFWQFVPAEKRQSLQVNLAGLGPEKPFLIHEHQVIMADGEVRTMRWTNQLVSEEGRQVVQAFGEDVTEQRLMEAHLLQGEKMATIAGLAAGVAHEINTPLSGILQAIQLIEMGLDPTQEQNRTLAAEYGLDLENLGNYLQQKQLNFFLQGIKESAGNAARIVADLLQFCRPHTNASMLVSLPEMIDRSIELAKADYTLKKEYNIINVEFIREYSPDLPEVNCVGMEIEQVLINLIKNSCQAMAGDDGPIDPHIIFRTKQRGERAVIEVEDNGPGMEPEVCRQVFDPFFTTKDIGKGTGLGLSVSYSIVCNKHGGNIEVESTPGKGTKFIIRLLIKGNGIHQNE